MVEPEIAENTVPATTATTASRPGTWAISRSMPSITFTARPVWNSTSPISTNSGIGVSEKLVTELTALRASCTKPGLAAEPEPGADDVDDEERERDRQAEEEQHGRAAEQQPGGEAVQPAHAALTASSRGPIVAVLQAPHAEHELDRQQQEADRQRRQDPPLGHHQRLDRERVAGPALLRRRGAVEHQPAAAGEAERVGEPLAGVGDAPRQRAQDDVDADVPALAQQPRRRQQRHARRAAARRSRCSRRCRAAARERRRCA